MKGSPAVDGDSELLISKSTIVGKSNDVPSASVTHFGEPQKQNGVHQSSVLHRSLRVLPKKVVEASGLILTLDDGQEIIDASSGAAVACLGHGNAAVKQAMFDQINSVSYCHSLFYGTSASEGLGDSLIASTDGQMARAFIVSSGSEAMEAAVKMARQYFLELKPAQPQRTRFIARKQSYHGTTLGALSIGGHVARRELYEPLLSTNVSHVSPCYAYRGMKSGETTQAYVARLAEELDQEFQRVGPGTVCAFVAEPVVGAVSVIISYLSMRTLLPELPYYCCPNGSFPQRHNTI